MNNNTLTALLNVDRSALPPDGGNSFNRLIFARSPYLLQHADNPVDWREWGNNAFAEARTRNIPLMISIGYSTCHWCHVMAEESFSDHEVARLLNRSFIAIKVDREERPDIDEFYMIAARVLTGGGGWPLNVFIDHDRRPFFAITYLPKLAQHRTPGFMDLLGNLTALWQQQHGMVTSNAEKIYGSIASMAEPPVATGRTIISVAREAIQQLEDKYDRTYGGFGNGVKFPMPVYLLFLLSRDHDSSPQSLSMALQTLERMSRGGINDQLAGGFHRYTVDRQWETPHFEKMLYDQAMLIMTYSEAFRTSGNVFFLETAARTAGFAINELMIPEGAFCAGLDADSEGEEGLFYTWSYDELSQLLGDDILTATGYWGVTRGGNLDGRSTLHRVAAPDKIATELALSADLLAVTINRCSEKLLAARSRRELPLRDPKVICAWNGLMISALVRLAVVSGEDKWHSYAADTARFILEKMVTPSGRLLRNWLGTAAPVFAFAEDYAFFCLGLSDLLAVGADPLWHDKLEYFGNELIRLFINDQGKISFGGLDTEAMPIAIPPLQDGVMPSAAGACATLLLKMETIFADNTYAGVAAKVLGFSRGTVENSPTACLSLIMAEEGLRSQLP